ncbi:MAG: glycoside hydrolase family 31 protein [Marinilabiliales bacterium]|nr:glycoside hydrolase family 31 protein [Marinilabiliales bacterium]
MKTASQRILILLSLFILTTLDAATAAIRSYEKTANGINCKLDNGSLRLTVSRDNMVRVQYSILPLIPGKQSLVVVQPAESQAPAFTISENAATLSLTTSRLRVEVNKATQSIRYFNTDGKMILSEDETQGKTMAPATIAGIDTYTCQTLFNSPADEALFGLGCHPEDSLSINYKGRNQDMVIKYMTGAIPVLLSTNGYGLLWDNYSASRFFGAEKGNTQFRYESESGDQVDYYFLYGPDFDNIISTYRSTTGQAPMFPKWAFGLFQSQDRYKSQKEVLEVKDQYRNNHIPVDCIVQDWFYWEPDVIGSHRMWPERYPNPKAMVDELHKANIHGMISIWPVFSKGTETYNQMTHAGGMTSIQWFNVMTRIMDNYYDAHSPQARDLYWKQANDSLISRFGWDAWWVDQCEPDNGDSLNLRRKSHFAIGRGIDYMNTYSLMHSQGLYEHWRKEIADKRAFLLIRQAFAGQQRNAATLWSSDITCTWNAYRNQIPQGINACTSGIPYWTSDIGGYHFHWNAPDWSAPVNRELFTRWFQFGTFSPIFRIHGKGERALFSANWDAPTKAILLTYDQLRYRLLPYIYSLSSKVTRTGYTLMRSLAFDFREDANVRNIPDQYMFGPALLVNPVTTRQYSLPESAKIRKSRKVYLPGQTDWYDFWTGKKWKGGQTIDAPAPIETIPVYVRAGSIVPMGPFLQYATEKPADPLEIRIYPGQDGSFELYEDENDNYHYEQNQFAIINFHWNDAAKTLEISDRKGHYAGMLQSRTFHIVLVSPGNGIGVAIAGKVKQIPYEGSAIKISMDR